jgi:hypothetical protein
MTIPYHFGLGSLWRAQLWAFERLSSLECGDFRWTMLALVSRWLSSVSSALVRNILCRAWQGARFAARFPTADTTVAAAGN